MAGLITNGEKCCKGSYRATCVKTGMQEQFDLLITKIKIKQKPRRQFSTTAPLTVRYKSVPIRPSNLMPPIAYRVHWPVTEH